MSILKTQTGISITGDFEEGTWTFEMQDGFEIAAGEFAIVPKDKYDKAIKVLNRISKIENAAFGLDSFNSEKLMKKIHEATCLLETTNPNPNG